MSPEFVTKGDFSSDFRNSQSIKLLVNVEKAFDNGLFDNNNNLINAINGHEGNGHIGVYLKIGRENYFAISREQRELNAIDIQRRHPSWEKTTEDYKRWVNHYETNNRNKLIHKN